MSSHRGVRPEAEEKCITVPELVYGIELEEKCIILLTYPDCQAI